MDALDLGKSEVQRIDTNYEFKFNISRYTKMDLISEDTFHTLDYKFQHILWTLLENHSSINKACLKRAISYVLKIWKYPYKVDNILAYEAMFFCAVEIAYFVSNSKDAFHRLEWCHKIQNSLTESEIQSGWRVSFSRNKYYYINHVTHERRHITFHREGGKKSTEEKTE